MEKKTPEQLMEEAANKVDMFVGTLLTLLIAKGIFTAEEYLKAQIDIEPLIKKKQEEMKQQMIETIKNNK